MTNIPHNPTTFQYCPKCGNKTLTPDNEQRYSCSYCDFLFYINTAGTVVAMIVNDEGKILFNLRGQNPGKGTLDLPGGFIDYHETAEQALKREVVEETNLQINAFRFLCSFPNQYPYKDVLYHSIDFFFICTVDDINALSPNDEITTPQFIAINDVSEDQIGFESIRRGISYLKEKVNTQSIDLINIKEWLNS